MVPLVSAFVLAGGRSSRMGTDKALLRLPNGQSLLARAWTVASTVTPYVYVLGSRSKYQDLPLPLIEDIYPGRGPLGGIHAALTVTTTELNLIVAVDMPAMTAECLQYLRERAQGTDALVVVPELGGHVQGLAAIYRKAFLPFAEEALAAGRNKVSSSFPAGRTLIISSDEFAEAGFGPELFRNVNTEDEWLRFRKESPAQS